MLSDEEKKAIEMIELHKDDFDNLEILLNLIEKQSKEIEELKTEIAKRSWVRIKENGEVEPLFYISKKKLYEHIEMLEKENCHETCGVKKLIDCGKQCSIGCTIKNIKKILEE